MKPLSEQDHYEVLELPQNASAEAVERAYKMGLVTYAEDSLACYSLVRHDDAAAMRERIETAYRVLADAESRRAYDASLASAREAAGEAAPEPAPAAARFVEGDAPSSARATRAVVEPFEDLEEGGEFDGARLRRARLRRGYDFEELAARTKVNASYLAFLEDERFADLPPRVYVRGFVVAYAGCLGLDGQKVAASYMRRYDEAEKPGRRRRFSLGT